MPNRLTLRLAVPFLLVSSVLLLMSLATAWAVAQLHATVTEVIDVNVPSIRSAPELEIRLRVVRKRLGRFLGSGDDTYLAALPNLRQDAEFWLNEADRAATTEHEQIDMAQVHAGYNHFFRIVDESSRPELQRKLLTNARRELDQVLEDEILPPLHHYLLFNERQTVEGLDSNKATVHRTMIVLVLLGICGPSAGIFTGWVIARRINRSIVRLSVPVQDATGRLGAVVGPMTLRPGWDLDELETVLQRAGASGRGGHRAPSPKPARGAVRGATCGGRPDGRRLRS